ncbi:CDP-alcohol phosphatidyltransferase [Arthrobacter sp. ERGS1:01]|uniref:CDP-alcohol phosphatidyltransferase family protein n=1 Tax=Arthrobacter sp. ERGS1:01 TaxID=1704044 RepID=UPI0006B5EA83|nr:CDP-alcohol phosphatidyltransferase family protein [Arthrobacter sp. ERGS1:01]ALE05150.1 CDP-alcohol phosphatidyltransferase [Arthrobacter sp. ERGS1:01]
MTTSRVSSPQGLRPRTGYRATVRELAGAQKKAAPGSPPYSIYVNRKVGRYIAAAAHRLGLTPNMVSAISAVFTMSGIVLIATVTPQWWLGLLVWAALAVGYAFDSADGQVARLRGGGSAAGEWLDHVLDSLKISSLHLAVLITAYRHFNLDTPAWLLVPIGYAIVAAVSFFSMILNDQLKTIHALRSGTAAKPKTAAGRSVLKTLLLVPTDYGVLCLIFLFLGAPFVFFALYTALFVANAGHLLLASTKWFRDMRGLDSK